MGAGGEREQPCRRGNNGNKVGPEQAFVESRNEMPGTRGRGLGSGMTGTDPRGRIDMTPHEIMEEMRRRRNEATGGDAEEEE